MAGNEAREGLEAEYEKLALEVDAEMLYLNTVGLRKLGEWLGIRSVRLQGKSRVAVLADVRTYLHRSVDAEDTVEGKVDFLRAMRDQIRHLMEEPDNWEQTPSRDRAMMVSPRSTRPRDSPASTPLPPLLRREGTTSSPQVDNAMDVDSHRTPSVEPPSLRRRLPTLPTFSDNSTAPWNRGHRQVSLDELSLQQSVKRRVEEDRQRQAERYTVSLESESEADTLAQLDGQSGDDDLQDTYTVDSLEEDDNARIKMLEKEIVELKLKRKRTDLSSKSSSSGSSTHRVPQPKVIVVLRSPCDVE